MSALQEIVDNCLLDKYHPYTGVLTECAQVDRNVSCYGLFDDVGNTARTSLVVLLASLVVVLSF